MIKITKTQARKRFEKGEQIFVLPNKIRFDNIWMQPFHFTKAQIEPDDFDTVINCYEYYNCNSETGKRCAYYVKEEN